MYDFAVTVYVVCFYVGLVALVICLPVILMDAHRRRGEMRNLLQNLQPKTPTHSVPWEQCLDKSGQTPAQNDARTFMEGL